jgi:hypothetical protein
MKDHLYDIAGRVFAVKTAGTIPMGPGWCLHRYMVSIEEIIPFVHQFRRFQDKTDMIQALWYLRFQALGGTMYGKIVIAR